MDKCLHDDEKICMSSPEHDCQHCSITGNHKYDDIIVRMPPVKIWKIKIHIKNIKSADINILK